MNDFVPPSLQEVWDWKKAAEEETRGMTREQLIEFYRQAGDEFEKQLGASLPRRPRPPRVTKLITKNAAELRNPIHE
ncbi:MAG TPA: hypothetical protein VJZ71_15025 [Phycisphaerae bacterium]|nr:hypothetical protein [Phycisphaerae bacterium]